MNRQHGEDEQRTGAPEGGPRPPQDAPPRPFGLRIAFYILVIVVALWQGSNLLLFLMRGAEGVQELVDSQRRGEMPEVQPMVYFWLQIFTAPIVFAVTAIFVASDRRPVRELGVALPARGTGGVVGQVVLAPLGVLAVLGGWRLLAQQWVSFTTAEAFPAEQVQQMGRWLPLQGVGLALFAGGFLVMALTEEVIFRGYVYAVLRERLPWIHAAGMSALLFVLFHPGSPEVLAPSLLNVFLLGLLAAALREATGSLLLGSLFSGLWNFFLASVLSLPVSGLLLPRLEPVEAKGPLWASGGGYGPEGSWLLTGFLVLAVLVATSWAEAQRPAPAPQPEDASETP